MDTFGRRPPFVQKRKAHCKHVLRTAPRARAMIRSASAAAHEHADLMLDDEGYALPRSSPAKRTRTGAGADENAGRNAQERLTTTVAKPAASPIRHVADLPLLPSLDGHYALGRTIGRGEFAKVKLATCLRTLSPVAIKLVASGPGCAALDRLDREIRIHAALRHPNIVRVHRVLRIPGFVAIVMEWIDGGELFEHVQRAGRLPEIEVRAAMAQILDGVAYIHSRRIVHRDLKLVRRVGGAFVNRIVD